MRDHGIRATAPRRFVRTTDSRHGLSAAENVLDRDFDPAEPNAAWASDITYTPTTSSTSKCSTTAAAGAEKKKQPRGRGSRGVYLGGRLNGPPVA